MKSLKWKVDGTHVVEEGRFKKNKIKLIIDNTGTNLAELICSSGYGFLLFFPEEMAATPKDEYKYLSIYKSQLILGERSWCLSAYNKVEYYNWFSRNCKFQEIEALFTPKELETLVTIFFREKMLSSFL